MSKIKFAWHVHHDVLCEPLVKPIEERRAYIIAHKSREQQALRLRLLQPVRGTLPDAAIAVARRERGWLRRVGTWLKRVNARHKLVNVLASHRDEIEALHAVECPDCPWDGRTIFPERRLRCGN